jgi:hydrogenase maturation protein HypF
VYKLAKEMQLNGFVKNGNDGVHIRFNATEKEANVFLNKINQSAPPLSKIISSKLCKTDDAAFRNFSIITDDEEQYQKQVLLSPDIAMCADCREELHDKNNRRYRYPFITCTQCGPRYSIIESIPFERQNTSMDNFNMCENCLAEYENVLNRRFFSQTNSCPACCIGFSISGNGTENMSLDPEQALLLIKNFLEQRKILAVKGIGGYLLICDANNSATIQLLRDRKHRPHKPFAILYPDYKTVADHFTLSLLEKELLESKEAPIVLLYPKQNAFKHLAVNTIAPGLKRLGIMLPYSPLLDLIATDYGKPLIATSGNISGSPVIYKEEDANDYLFEIADYIINYDRHIIIPQDDSVVQVSGCLNQKIILRRSRGYAPSFLEYKPKKKNCTLSTGAFLKSSFTLSVNENVFVSQFLGSGESYESQQMYKDTLTHWLQMYKAKPGVVITDSHPDYFSHQYAVELAEKYQSGIKFVQHHEAHFAAVLAENNLLCTEEPVLGIIWDGTGLGADGNIWGGEFFLYCNKEIQRCYHLDYFPLIAGDKAAQESRIAALCAVHTILPEYDGIKNKFTGIEWNNYQSLLRNTKLYSSSVGRLFDAVASLLNICDKQTYEGEAALLLQVLAEEYVNENGFEIDRGYFNNAGIFMAALIEGIIEDIKKRKDRRYIAAKFHYSLACMTGIVAKSINISSVCFSGGVFQNALLVDWIKLLYGDTLQLYFHEHLSPNDENISFGQFVYYDNDIVSKRKEDDKNVWQEKFEVSESEIISF